MGELQSKLQYQLNFSSFFSVISILGNCEEELPKKPVGQLSVDCQPTDYRQVTDRLPTGYQQTADSRSTVGRQVFQGALLHNYHILHISDITYKMHHLYRLPV